MHEIPLDARKTKKKNPIYFLFLFGKEVAPAKFNKLSSTCLN
jgi:hypothetical protein